MTDFVVAPWTWPRAVSSVLVTPPDEEPITLDQAKLAAGLDWSSGDPRDDQMLGFIAAARQHVEFRTGLALLTQTREVTIRAVPGALVPMPWQALPVQSITDVTGTRLDHLVDAAQRTFTMPRMLDTTAAAITYTYEVVSGWPDALTLAQEAPGLVQAVTLLTAHMATLGRDLAVLTPAITLVPIGFEDAIAPYCQVWVP